MNNLIFTFWIIDRISPVILAVILVLFLGACSGMGTAMELHRGDSNSVTFTLTYQVM